jgi:amino acid transporter
MRARCWLLSSLISLSIALFFFAWYLMPIQAVSAENTGLSTGDRAWMIATVSWVLIAISTFLIGIGVKELATFIKNSIELDILKDTVANLREKHRG